MTTPLQTLETCLDQQLALARQFMAALQDESRLLQTPAQTHLLAASTAAKLACTQQFATLDKVCKQALTQLGYSPDKQGLEQAQAQHPALASQLAALQDIATQAQDLNTSNGAFIDTYLRHTQQTLSDLRQLTGQGVNPMYSANGRPSSAKLKGRTHIKAG